MSQTVKIVLGIIVVIALLAAGYWYWQMRQTAQTALSPAAAADVTTLPSGTATSAAAINSDLTSIDAQLNAVHSDNTSASQSVDAAVQ